MAEFSAASERIVSKITNPKSAGFIGHENLKLNQSFQNGTVKMSWPVCIPRAALPTATPIVSCSVEKSMRKAMEAALIKPASNQLLYSYDAREMRPENPGAYQPRLRERYVDDGIPRTRPMELQDLKEGSSFSLDFDSHS